VTVSGAGCVLKESGMFLRVRPLAETRPEPQGTPNGIRTRVTALKVRAHSSLHVRQAPEAPTFGTIPPTAFIAVRKLRRF